MAPNLRWFHRLTAVIRGRRLQSDLDDELLFHIEARTRDNIASGMSPDDAALAARRLFGNRALMTERMRDADVNRWLDGGLRNLRYAVRVLSRNPGFAITVILSMALGIGATTAVFTLLNAALLRTLPVKNPHELVTLEARVKTADGDRAVIDGMLDFPVLDGGSSSEVELFATSSTSATTALGNLAEEISVGLVTGNFYSALGVQPAAGRLLERRDNTNTEANLVAVLDHEFWHRRFGGDPSVVGRTIALNDLSFSIVGVTPPEFTGISVSSRSKVTIPMQAEHRFRNGYSFREIGGRLRPGVSREQASSVLTSLFQSRPAHRDDVIVVKDNSRGEYRDRDRFEQPLYVLMGAVTLLLVIASANVASLLLARGTARRREISIRLAIGAGRGSIAAQVLTESVLIAVLGGALGVGLAYWGAATVVGIFGVGTTHLPLDVQPDARVLLFTTCVAVLTGLVFGLFPAFQACRTELNPTLKDGTAGVGRRPTARRALVVAQVALSLMLLSGALSFAKSLANLRSFDSGYDRRGVLLAEFEPNSRYPDERRHELQRALLERVRAIPGVDAAGVASTPVLSAGNYGFGLEIDGRSRPCEGSMTIASDGFLEAMRMRLLAGRTFTADDNRPGAPHAIIVNQEIVRRCFASENPIGRRVQAGFGVRAEIVGIVGNGKYRDLREDTVAMYYIPPRSVHPRGLSLHLRTSFDPRLAIEPVREALRAVDPAVPLSDPRTIDEQSDRSVIQDRLLAFMSTIFGIGALSLAAIGLYGVVAFLAVRRTSEIGLRLALGAQRIQIARLILAESSWLLVVGGAIGAVGAYAGRRLIQGLLFSVSPADWWSLLGAAAVLFAVGLLASLVPAQRAARIDPIAALRHE
jgi:predicted permease